ncbi:hypothetical protein [Sphingobacterium detergens]
MTRQLPFDGCTQVVHEFFGLFFFISAIFYIILNWKVMPPISKEELPFLPPWLNHNIFTFMVEQQYSPKVDPIILERISKAAIADSLSCAFL